MNKKRYSVSMLRLAAFFVLTVVLIVAVFPATAAPATFDVDRFDDDAAATACTAAANDCSLRGAITAANSNANPADIDIINLLAGTYTLSIAGTGEEANATGDLDITQSVSIVGAGADVTIIDADSIDRVLDVDPGASGVTVSISGVTITGGNGFVGGIRSNAATLDVLNSTITGNIDAGGDVAGLFNQSGTTNIVNSAVSGNTATNRAAGVANNATMNISGSTISGNTATNDGGGVYNQNGTLTITDTTIVNNASTSGNGGGIFIIGGTVNIGNSIVANNAAGGTGPDINGTVQSQDYNLIEDTTGATINGTTTHNITGSNPNLLPLAYNGGTTQTHAFGLSSPVTDAGNCVATTDQRGSSRPVDWGSVINAAGGNACDIGAFELQNVVATLNVTKTADTADGVCDADCSLREAITAANTNGNVANTDVINIPAGTYTLSIAGAVEDANATGDLDILQSVELLGAGSGTTIIDANGIDRVLHAQDPSVFYLIDLFITDLAVTNGDLVGDIGAGIYSIFANLNITRSVISDNTTDTGMAGIYAVTKSLTLNDSTVSDNISAASYGGFFVAPAATNSKAIITGSTITGNRANAGDYGAGLFLMQTVTLTNTTITNNVASANFGGPYLGDGTGPVTVNGSTISNNMATAGSAAGLFTIGTNTAIVNSTIDNNTAQVDYGGLYTALAQDLTIDNTTISNNTASTGAYGGGFVTATGSVSINGSTITNNTAQTTFGGLQVSSTGSTFVNATTISGNTANTGDNGGAAILSGGAIEIVDSTIDSNTAQGNFGGIQTSANTLSIHNTDISNNTATTGAIGGLFASGASSVEISDSTISSNTAQTDFGGLYVPGSTNVTISNTTIADNTAGDNFGGARVDVGSLLRVTDTTVSGNAATAGQFGGMYASGGTSHSFLRSQFTGNTAGTEYGGLFSAASFITIADTTIADNVAATNYGGVYVNGQATIRRSTISGNIATTGFAGGLFNSVVLNLVNSTVSGNQAPGAAGDGAGIFNASQLNANNVTVVNNTAGNNGGGIFNIGTLNLGSSIVHNNTAATGGPDLFGSVNSLDFNIIGDTSDATILGDTLHNQIGVDPLLGILADNGGPTLTHDLPVNSPAVDAGSCPAALIDQRGLPRPVDFPNVVNLNGGCDIGAVERQDSPPTAIDDSYNTPFETALTVDAASGVLINDLEPDNQLMTAALVSDVTNGTLAFNPDGSFSYTPNATFSGSDSFTYTASDGNFTSTPATVTITVENPIPVATDDAYTTNASNPLNVDAINGVLANDTDNSPITAVLATGPAQAASFTLNADGSFQYAPNAAFVGTDTFTYTAFDGLDSSPPATVTITVENAVSTAVNDIFVTSFGATLTVPAPGVLGNDLDANGNALTAILFVSPLNGTVVLKPDGSFSYTPVAGFTGTDTFTYIVNDGTEDSDPAVVFITVNKPSDCSIGVNEPPIRPILTWGRPASENPVWYEVVLWNADVGLLAFDEWFDADSICTGTNCTLATDAFLLPFGLINGAHELYVRSASNTTIFEDWRKVADLTIDLALPATLDAATTTVEINQGRPSLVFPQDANALYYLVYIGTQGTFETMHLQWYEKTAVCCAGTCELNLDAFLSNGNYVMFVQSWGPGGYGAGGIQNLGWGGPFNFALSFSPPTAVTNMATALTGTQFQQPTFMWDAPAGATQYQIWVGTITPQSVETAYVIAAPALDLGCAEAGSTCGLSLPGPLPTGTYRWYVQASGPGGNATGGVIDGWAEGPAFSYHGT